MPIQEINQQSQVATPQSKNINLSPGEFSKLLESLKNPSGANTQAINETDAPQTTTKRQPITLRQKVLETPQQRQNTTHTNKSVTVVKQKKIIAVPQQNKVENSSDNLIKLGKINKDYPTISHLLKENSTYKNNTWNIIFSDINKSKQFNKIPTGAVVSINTMSNELVWSKQQTNNEIIPIPENVKPENITNDGLIIIGEISKDSPTVSHLLKQNSFYGDYTWKIIFSDVNKSKQYSSLTNGKIVTIDPKTYELSFVNKKDIVDTKPISVSAAQNLNTFATDYFDQNSDFSKRLADSVKSYIGTPYNKIDCYGLVIRGIENQGIDYNANGGIRDRMIKMAKEQGLPVNAYQNGEGLIETSGTKLYGKSYVSIKDATIQSSKVYEEIQPILKEGEVLSFSMPSQGHTGIISRKNNEWTYVNSGVIDNQVDAGASGKRVGEENLIEELKNWFSLAKNKNESLKISIGVLDEEKLQTGNRLIAQSNI